MSKVIAKIAAARTRRMPRPDGAATRLRILDTAGRIFAEQGYAQATSKEICTRAGTNLASVNYHFGSRIGLYEEVLIEAHRQIVSMDDLTKITRAPGDPRQKLRTLLTHLLALSAKPAAPWGFRVILREAMAPSQVMPALVEKAVRPKAKVLLGLIAEIVDLPPDHPAVQRSLFFSVFPCMGLLIAPKEIANKVLPAVAKDTDGLLDELMRFVLAGLEAVSCEYRTRIR